MPPVTRRTPPHQVAGRRQPVVVSAQDKLRTVAEKAAFKPFRKNDALSNQFTKLCMADLATDGAKLLVNGNQVQVPQPIGSKLLSNLLEEQTRYLPHPEYLKKVQKDGIEEYMRHDIVSWMLQVCTIVAAVLHVHVGFLVSRLRRYSRWIDSTSYTHSLKVVMSTCIHVHAHTCICIYVYM